MEKLTKEQAAVLGAFTGVACGPFEDLHEYAEKLMGRPVWTHEFAGPEFSAVLREKSKDDFMAIAYEGQK